MSADGLLRRNAEPNACPVTVAVQELAHAGGVEERGAIFTRREVVEFILDLVGYTADRPLYTMRLLEPAFGAGDFLIPAIDRLLTSWKNARDARDPTEVLGDAICAVELHSDTFSKAYYAVVPHLIAAGIPTFSAKRLADRWLINGDFLLVPLAEEFDVVVGNPPYVRTERIPDVLMAEYRSRYKTIYDRADLYVPFIERALRSLTTGGTLGFICADRWMKNRYGGPLRELVATHYHLKAHVDMTDTDAFKESVIAYPAITVISRQAGAATRVASRPAIDTETLSRLTRTLTARTVPKSITGVRELVGVTRGAEPWLLEDSAQMALISRLEAQFPSIEEAGCKVGIGVATGADKAYIGPYEELDVEEDRKLPLVMTRDINSGHVKWRGLGVINPFRADGGLVPLEDYPKLRRHLEARRTALMARHVAQKIPANWYRTIDRITPSLANKPKLLIPDIKGDAQIVFEEGKLYPHHNLYFITADEWDLRALQAVLLSGIARLFVATYSTRMRGGFLRFQAQYLRRIRVPHWKDVPQRLRHDLKGAAERSDLAACNKAALVLYGLTPQEQCVLNGSGDTN